MPFFKCKKETTRIVPEPEAVQEETSGECLVASTQSLETLIERNNYQNTRSSGKVFIPFPYRKWLAAGGELR